MMQVDSHRSTYNTPGLRHYESPDSNSSNTSPPAITHTSRPSLVPEGTQHNTLVHWNHTQSTHYDKTPQKSDDEDEEDDDEYRPFTPPPPRERLSYTRYQLELLSGIYEKVRYPNSTQKQLIAKRVGITREQVKIWFQNRRRKDVINNPKQKDKTEASNDGNSMSAENEQSTTPDSSDKNQQASPVGDSDGPKMVPNVVLKSVISELERFEKGIIKAKKAKKKSRQKQQHQQQQKQLQKTISSVVTKANPVSLFNAYDMISPPNKVISSGLLDTSANRFSHSKSTSAFQDPKSNSDINKCSNSLPSPISGYHHGPNSITVLQNEYASHHANSITASVNNLHKAHSVFENIPVLADLLGYKSGDPMRSQKHHMTYPMSPRNPYTSPRSNPEFGYNDIPGSVNHGSLGVNRVFPFPFIADAPVMLSSVRHPDPYRTPVHYLPPQHTDDPYQPFMISSFTNPYYSAVGTSTQTWPPQQTATNDNNFTTGSVL